MFLFFNINHCIICIVLCYMCVPANGKNNCLDSCDRTTLEASLGSTVLLNCSFKDTWLGNSSHQKWVFWSRPPGSRLDTDLGWYCCEWGDECRRVELTKAEEGAWNKNIMHLFYITTGVVIFILLLMTCCVFHWKFTGHCKKSQPDYENEDFHTGTTARAPPPEVIACDEHIGQGEEQQQRDANGGIIYENNEHDPTINQQQDITRNVPNSQDNQSTNESQRRHRVTFHRELFSRLRQASLGRHSYVNQAELNQQARSPIGNGQRASFWRKRAKHKCEYENPLYNNNMDQLNL
ncbi:uncharacterized protein [Osmerus mordax]|uniref:uncharacterized protein isoform X2 n=1 Tax=Osmerus mordax TaxID=8014 RepID=UPI00350F4D87